ncbi:MAG: potassium channel family protein [Bacteroidetes bacterium]|nr:potassium channel family protein [Bacteroidota bacterium]MBP9190518.1 potassium channel family protein [Chitinophagales bacterium]MBP9549660.1 potassium channel family protein [Chitinophagales bacterium]MBP9705600.1 potassium channel family protein [Chitinophagales bacterium]
MYKKIKKEVHILLHPTEGDTKGDKILNAFIITLILLNLAAVMLETEASIYQPHKYFFHAFDVFSVIIFSIEYVLRVWSCTYEAKYKHWFWGRIKYMLTWEAMIDLLAILPFFLHSIFRFDLRVLRILRLLRLLRIFRLTGYMRSSRMISNVFKNHRHELMLSFTLALSLIIISSCIIFFAEHDAQPEKFKSIPDTLWWSVTTLTTIGYGDMIPITIMGKLLTGIIALTGVALFALPAGIITAGFLQEFRKTRRTKIHVCPHCGKDLDVEEDNLH